MATSCDVGFEAVKFLLCLDTSAAFCAAAIICCLQITAQYPKASAGELF